MRLEIGPEISSVADLCSGIVAIISLESYSPTDGPPALSRGLLAVESEFKIMRSES
jgi:hypothetical protein